MQASGDQDPVRKLEKICFWIFFPNIDNHIAQYKQWMLTVAIQKELREPTMCKGFGSTLTGPALQWYISLPTKSIRSFAALSEKFWSSSPVVGALKRAQMISMKSSSTGPNRFEPTPRVSTKRRSASQIATQILLSLSSKEACSLRETCTRS